MRQLSLSSKTISPELRKFALTLHFYSPNAYDYVRNIFNKSLPHPSTIRKWYATVDGRPGLTSESLRAIQIKVREFQESGKQLIGGLMLDEMCIKENVHWTGSRYQGFIDYGPGSINEMDNLPYAKDALVIMVVAYNAHWKIPVGYYLINGLPAEEKANIIKTCLSQLHSTGILIKSLTFDGASSNIAMAKVLGANIHYPYLQSSFDHPETNEKVHLILDPCHMLKLCRNTLGDWGLLLDDEGQQIKWSYFNALVNIQNKTGLHLATKIRSQHINYTKEKMRVRLAVQTFSNSVADAMEYCMNDLKLPEFQGAEATIKFCRLMNNIFDILNTRNFLSKNTYNKPINENNKESIIQYVNEGIMYIEKLQCFEQKTNNVVTVKLLLQSNRRTGFQGLILCLKSLINLTYELINGCYLKFILSYKLSQDHLEILFSAIRAKGGFNNNPTVTQFEAAYKALLVHAEIKSNSSANCLAQDSTSILKISSLKKKSPTEDQDAVLDLLCAAGSQHIVEDDDELLTVYQNSNYIKDVVGYIAGFVVRSILKRIQCEVCAKEIKSHKTNSLLLNKKNRGGLTMANADVVSICQVAERTVREYTKKSNHISIDYLVLKSISILSIDKYFLNLTNHFMDQEPLNNHLLQMIRLILKTFITIRIHHINTSSNEIDKRVRRLYTKLIHFQHQ